MLREKVNGSISVFLAVSVTLVLSFCMVLIESARENTLLLKADIIFDAGLKSVMAEYSVPLWEKYDLLYVDCRYGSDRADFELVKSHLAKYINKNLEYENRINEKRRRIKVVYPDLLSVIETEAKAMLV